MCVTLKEIFFCSNKILDFLFWGKKKHMNQLTSIKIQSGEISYLDSYLRTFFFFKLHSTRAESESERKSVKYTARYRRSDGWVWIKTGFLDLVQDYETKLKSSSLPL